MRDNTKAMVLASFAADTLALGVHWIYDTAVIDDKFGRVDSPRGPGADSFHSTKTLGEFTHYGDQTLVLLKSISACRSFDPKDFGERWKMFFEDYSGYFDHATKETLANFERGKSPETSGSTSSDLGGAARIAPLVHLYRNDSDNLIQSVRAQTMMTHNDALVIESAEFLANVAVRILNGSAPDRALRGAVEPFKRLRKPVHDGLESTSGNTRDSIRKFGQMCDAAAALPCVVHLTAKYEDNLEEALIENVMAGGDSAARGMIVGALLGAHHGMESIPKNWLEAMKKTGEITDLLDTVG